MAGFLSPGARERIRAASDIVDVIGAYLPLKKAGGNFTALCPFHKEKTPSFNVNPHKQTFHCFGCHKGGDVFTFVETYENIGFMDAVRRLAERARIPLEFENSPGAQESRHLKDQLLDIHEQLAQRWQNCLASESAGQAARDYLAGRGVSPEAIKLFRIGAAPDAWDDTVNWARSKKFDLATVEKAGVIVAKGSDGGSPSAFGNEPSATQTRYYDRFRGRLMFPICDEQGRVIGFSGRVLSEEVKTAKYVNSPETLIFSKSRIFFGLDKSKRAILDAGLAIICEGQLDLIACYMNGVRNIVAPQGTAFTEQHARILNRYAKEVVLCFDSDNAGQEAAVRALDHLLAAGFAVRVAVVPAPHDPDSYIKACGGPAFQRLIDTAEGFFDYYLKRLCAQHDPGSDKGRLAILRGMAESVLKTGNGVLMDTYAQKTALRLGVSAASVRAEFQKTSTLVFGKRERHKEAVEAGPPEDAAPRPSPAEFHLLKLLLLHDELAGWALQHLDIDWIVHGAVRQIAGWRLAAQENGAWRGVSEFLDNCELPAQRNLITEAVAEDRKIPEPEKQLADVALKLRNQFLERQIAALTHKIILPETSDDDKTALLREQMKLKEQKRQPLAPLPR